MNKMCIFITSIVILFTIDPCHGFQTTPTIINKLPNETNFQIENITIGNSTKEQVMDLFGKTKIQHLVIKTNSTYNKYAACYTSSEIEDTTGIVCYFFDGAIVSISIYKEKSDIPSVLLCSNSSKVNKHIKTKSGISLNNSLETNISKVGKVIYFDSNEVIILATGAIKTKKGMNLDAVSKFSFDGLKRDIDKISISRTYYN